MINTAQINTVHVSLDILKYKKDLPQAAGLIIIQNPAAQDMQSDLKDAFYLTKHLAADIIESGQSGGGLLATVSRLDGAFGFKGNGRFNPDQGGLAALAKTAAVEWEHVCCHAIDIAPDWQEKREICKAIVSEILTPGPVEIGLEPQVRHTLELIARLSGPGSCAVCDVLSDPRRAGLMAKAQRQMLDATMAWIYSEPFLWHCQQDQIAGFFASCGLAVLEDIGLDELVSRYTKRDSGWLEAAPSLRLVVSKSV